MPVVFVHGVGNHDQQRFAEGAGLRDAFFKRFLSPPGGGKLAVHNPYWGAIGASPRWGNAWLADAALERLAVETALDEDFWELVAASLAGRGNADASLPALARVSLPDAVDLLYSAIDPGELSGDDVEALAALAGRLADLCAEQDRAEAVVAQLPQDVDDALLISTLLTAASEQEQQPPREILGSGDAHPDDAKPWLNRAASTIRSALLRHPAVMAASAVRKHAGAPVASFLGDVFRYLALRGTPEHPGEVVCVVLTELRKAQAQASSQDPLVVVAHSLGGDIIYDIASRFDPDLRIDTLVTVGSQVALFAELSLFEGIPADLEAQAKVPAIPAIRSWINVVDRADILAYRAEPVFQGAVDREYPSGAVWAHSAYFKQPNFYRRLAARLAEQRT